MVDYRRCAPFDLVICQGVLPYLGTADLKRALHNHSSRAGAMYLKRCRAGPGAGHSGRDLTDPRMFRHRAACTGAGWTRFSPRSAGACGSAARRGCRCLRWSLRGA